MPLKDVRDIFVDATGRRDLVNSDGSNRGGATWRKGANWFINQGQRFLEGKLQGALQRHAVSLPVGAWFFHAMDARELHQLWATTADGRKRLERKPFAELWAHYKPLATSGDVIPPIVNAPHTCTGCPRYWSPLPVELSAVQNNDDVPVDRFGQRFDLDGAAPLHSARFKGAMFYPALSEASTLTLFGRFWPPQLEGDFDQSWWTENAPDLLVLAARYKLNQMYSNREGAKDLLDAIMEDITGYQKAQVAEQWAEVNSFPIT